MAIELAQAQTEPADGDDTAVEPTDVETEDVLNEGATGEEISVPVSESSGEVTTEVGADESLFPPFDANAFPSHLFWLAISFGILFFFVNRLIVPKVGGILEDRRDRIASDLGEASRLSRETDEVIAAYESELASARQRAFTIAQQRRDEIKAEQARQQEETEEALAKRIQEAEAEIAARRDKALADVDAIAAEATQAIVDRLAGITLSDDDANAAVSRNEAGRA